MDLIVNNYYFKVKVIEQNNELWEMLNVSFELFMYTIVVWI